MQGDAIGYDTPDFHPDDLRLDVRVHAQAAEIGYGHAPGLTFPARRRDDHQA